MYSYRGRGGPRQSTPANVQCQKCLKRGHYSYECKTGLQERPYNARPSRTQQLLNPKLAPKLTNDAPDLATKKKGVADEELAKKEAERARKRDLEDDDEPGLREPNSTRQRSISVDSVSSISTRSSKSPPPPRRARDVSPPRQHRRSRSIDSVSDGSQGRATSPVRDHRPRNDRYGRSPDHRERLAPRARRYSSDSGDGRPQKRNKRHDSRSPGRTGFRDRRRPDEGAYRDYRDRHDGQDQDREVPPRARQEPRRAPPPQPGPPRERSLSPFSKRLALTQSMNMGR